MAGPNIELWNELAAEVAARDENGRFETLPDAAEKVTANLIASTRRPNLASLVRGYFEVAFAFDAEGATEASGAILVGIAEAQPHLPKLTAKTFEAIRAESQSLVGAATDHRAPVHDTAAPDGTLKLSSFLHPGRPQTRRR